MARFISQDRSNIGLSPFEPKFKGEKRTEQILLRLIDFDEKQMKEETLKSVDEALPYLDTNTVTWLNIDGLHDETFITEVGRFFNLDRMVVSDVLDTNIRPKVHEYENCLYIELKMMRYDEQNNQLIVESLSLVIADQILISFQESRGDVFDPVRDRIRNNKKKIRNSSSDYLAFALLDIVIDNYIYVLSILGERIESMEEKLLKHPDNRSLLTINKFKREINFMRKNILPAREMINSLAKVDSDFIDQEVVGVHLKELQSNISQAVETSDSYREILSDQLNIYHTTIASKLNDIMKFLTIFSVIFIPLTFIAGIYGTNFDYLPELHFKYSYFIMWGAMIVLTVIMLFYFRRKKWL
ncbi:MAG: magnesium/cobalt transporter CorA [Salibacteraceae bacterium]